MSQPHTVLAHLLEGRDELVREVQRLTTAIAELDAVIERVGGTGSGDGLPVPAAPPVTGRTRGADDGARGTARRAKASGGGRPARRSSPAAARSAVRRSAPKAAGSASSGAGQKSIRVHVLEMLAAEDREFGLGEIIERIHGAGIAAHDDAVRSITIKLMKDGQVERVGRGQYRLAPGARSGAVDAAAPAGPGDDPGPAAPAAGAQGGSAAGAAPSLNLGEQWGQPAR